MCFFVQSEYMRKNLLVFGCGQHAQDCQYYILNNLRERKNPISVRLLVELDVQRQFVETFLQKQSLQPEQCFFLPEEDRNSSTIHPDLLAILEKIKPQLDGVLICTEPRAHKKYIEWAIKNNLDILSDKPLTAPPVNQTGPSQIWQDYLDIENWLQHSHAKLTLMTNKRLHKAFSYLYEQVKEAVLQYHMPITHIEISDACGVWTFPQEYARLENHPHKYGYGVLLHTGFHYIDLLTHFQRLNHLLGLKEDYINVNACGTTPYDVLHQMTAENYNRLFHTDSFTQEFNQIDWNAYKQYGLLDMMSSFQFIKDDAIITQASLTMLQNTLSSRTRSVNPLNFHLGVDGKQTLTHIGIFLGPLFYARLSYCQPTELSEEKPMLFYGVECYRNSRLVGGKPYQRQIFQDFVELPYLKNPVTLNHVSKEQIVMNWLQGQPPQTDFSSYACPIHLTAHVFEEIFRQRGQRGKKDL